MLVVAPPVTVIRRVVPASALPVKIGVGSLVKPPEAMTPSTGDTLSLTLVIRGMVGARASTVKLNVVAGLSFSAMSTVTKVKV